MDSQNKNIPALRFPEFGGDWKEERLGDIGGFKNGLNKGAEDFGFGYPFINLMDVFGKPAIVGNKFSLVNASKKDIETYSLLKGDVLFIRSSVKREGVGETSVVLEDIPDTVYSGFLIRFREFAESLDLFFKKYCFHTYRFRRNLLSLSTSSANTNINQDSLSDLVFAVPRTEEQQKIAAFLTAVDEKIGQLSRKKELLTQYKKGVMQQIFDQQIRFKDDSGNNFPDWEDKALKEVVVSHNSGIYKNSSLYGEGANIIGVSDLYSIDAIDGQEFRLVPLTNEELAKFTLAEGDLLYGESSLVRDGIAKTLFVTKNGAGTAFAWHTRRFSVDNSKVNSAYLFYHLGSSRIRNMIRSVATQTALTGITTKEYFNIVIKLPSLVEQARIADFLSQIDSKIHLVAQQLGKTQAFKKGLLQQMFV